MASIINLGGKLKAQDEVVNDTTNQALFYNDIGIDKYHLNEIDSCLIYLDKAAILAEKEEDWDLLIIVNSNIFVVNDLNGNFEAAEKGILRSKRILEKYLQPNSKAYVQACDALGTYYTQRGDKDTGIDYYNKAIQADSISDKYWISTMRNIQITYLRNADYENAIIYHNRIMKFIEDLEEDNQSVIAGVYSTLGKIYKGKEQRDSAQIYLLKSKELFDRLPRKKNAHEKVSQVENLIPLLEFSLENEESNLSTKELLYEFEQLFDEEFIFCKNELFLKKAWFYESMGDIELANKNLTLAKSEAEKIYAIYKNHPALGKAYEYDAKFLFKKEEYSAALRELKKAFNFATIRNQEEGVPNEYYSPPSFLDQQQGIRFFRLRIECYEALYQETNDLEQLKKIGHAYENLSDLLLHFRDQVQNQSSELNWSQRLTEVYRAAVNNALLLHKKTNDPTYLEKAFLYSECNKAATLAEKVSYEKTLKGILPEEVLTQLQDLKIDIAFYQKQINNEKRKVEQDSTKLADWAEIVTNLEEEYESLENETKKKYPDYAKATKTFKPSTVAELRQEFLKENTALVEYFSTDDSWFVFTLTREDLTVHEIPKDEKFDKAFTPLLEAISQRPNSSSYVQGLKDFSDNSHKLFELLLQKSLVNLPETVTNLLIIPDGRLSHLPFELLLTEAPSAAQNLSYLPTTMPYLFNKYNLSYGFSATVANLTNDSGNRANTGSPAIFSPSFSAEYLAESRSCREGGLSYLECNATEGELINNLVSGEFFAGDSASIQRFREVAANAPILHLATHACMDEENMGANKIFFADTYLTNDDLNAVGVNADLVVLSACDTGLGVMVEGEGLMSLSRGFLCAGAASTVMSLWSVDDCATSNLMVSFYEELKNGKNKSTALKNAKLAYLNQADKLHQHPYFWAPFVLSGNADAIDIASNSSNFLYAGLVGIILLLFAFWGYRKMN